MVLYTQKPHPAIRAQARTAIDRFVNKVTLKTLAYCFDMEGNPEELTTDAYNQLMSDWFSGSYSGWPNANIKLLGAGGTAPGYALTYCGKGLQDADFPDDTGYLDMWVTREFFDQNVESIEDLFVTTATELVACSGYMTLALAGEDRRAKQALGARYRALDIASPLSVSIDLGTKSPGSYWFNYMGSDLAARSGGTAEILGSLGPAAEVWALPGGRICVRLGAVPALGDRNRQEALADYEAFARFLATRGLLHVPKRGIYFKDAQGLADRDAQEAWHQRFATNA
jgi:hypothetical protein